ncbi:MAG TPA: aminopeptidase N [Mycobacteriales bacterium]|nr:aminopeptidase N [Mycobacteriales bacterium]
MTVENLTREEARERARILSVASYEVHLDLTSAITDMETFRSTSVARFTCSEPGATPHIDITADAIVEATLNGEAFDTSSFTGRRVTLPPLAESNELRIIADCRYMRTGEGLHRFVDPVDKETYLYSQFEAFDAHRVYASFDQPDLKATFSFTVDAPTHWQVASNMPGASDTSKRDVTRWTFEPTPRQSSYVTVFVAGPYVTTYDEHDGIPLGIYCRQSLAQYLDADEIFTITKQGFDFFHETFGYRYPWPKYDQLFVPECNFGAMENPGAVTFTEDYIFRSKVTDVSRERRAVTILHEMAHMWFGDLVTMRWWDDLWLNESFAEFASTVATAEATKWPDAWATFCNTEKAWAYRQDQLPTTHPVAADIPDIEAVAANFDGITYAKGASVLKQLVHYVGRDAFFAALRGYFRRHEYGNTTLQDLLDALAEASGRDLSTWSKEWLQSAGVNTLRAEFAVGDDGTFTSFELVQDAPEEHPTLRSHRLSIGLYDRTSEGMLRREQVDAEIAGQRTELPELIGRHRADLVLINDDDHTYAKVRLDDTSLRTLLDHIGELHEPLARALCWYAAWDMTRDAEMRAGDFLDLVIAGVHLESGVQTVQSLLTRARSAIDPYGDPAHIASRTQRLADAAHSLMRSAPPGDDIQLAAIRALAANASSKEHLGLLSGLLDGTTTVDGLVVDADLRWTLLHRLVVLGRAGDREITNELDRDNTAAGRRHSMRLHASIPTEAAKAEAWRLATEEESLSNAEQRAVIAGFQEAEHRELLRPYVERYFDVVGPTWQRRTTEMAEQIAVGLYPHQIVEQAVIDRTDAYLRAEQPVPALRRLIVEDRDLMARALRTRAFDRG